MQAGWAERTGAAECRPGVRSASFADRVHSPRDSDSVEYPRKIGLRLSTRFSSRTDVNGELCPTFPILCVRRAQAELRSRYRGVRAITGSWSQGHCAQI